MGGRRMGSAVKKRKHARGDKSPQPSIKKYNNKSINIKKEDDTNNGKNSSK